MSLSNCWEAGQAYVALSRLRALECLHLISFDPKSIKADTKVKKFYDALPKSESMQEVRSNLSQMSSLLLIFLIIFTRLAYTLCRELIR